MDDFSFLNEILTDCGILLTLISSAVWHTAVFFKDILICDRTYETLYTSFDYNHYYNEKESFHTMLYLFVYVKVVCFWSAISNIIILTLSIFYPAFGIIWNDIAFGTTNIFPISSTWGTRTTGTMENSFLL